MDENPLILPWIHKNDFDEKVLNISMQMSMIQGEQESV